MKVGIVGSGMVGATAAYALVMRGVGREIVLVDQNQARAEAEADDIRHAVPFAHDLVARAGGYGDLADSRIVVVCAGVAQKPGETRLDLLARNAAVFREVIPAVVGHAPTALILIATNPVDVMTHLATRIASQMGVPLGRVFGSGTTLDSARFRTRLGTLCQIDPHQVHADVIGEHGDSSVLAWSLVTIGGMPLEAFARHRGIGLSEPVRQEIDQKVRRAAYTIVAAKGSTYYGIGSALARIIEVVLRDERSVLTICSHIPEVAGVRDVTLGLPTLFDGTGVIGTLPIALSDFEQGQLRASAEVIRRALEETGLG